MTLHLHIGALADPVTKQLAEQGVRLRATRGKAWDDLVDAVSALYVAGIITPAERDRIGRRLVTALDREIRNDLTGLAA